MKDRLITGAGFWTATSLVLVAGFAAVIALPYMGSPTAHITTAAGTSATTLPVAARTSRRTHTPDTNWQQEMEATAAMYAQARNAPAQPRPAASTTRTTTTESSEAPLDPIDLGRAALAMVGTDPDAEQVWLAIINDPAIDPEARKDLIEDLNEDGFADPDNLTPKDLPLIEARLALLDKLIPEPMDDTNAAAFVEAHKDLVEMRNRLKPELRIPAEPRPEPSR